MTTKPDFNLLMDLLEGYSPKQRGIVSNTEIQMISKRLELERRTEIELRNMRNFSVIFLSNQADSARKQEMEGKPSAVSYVTFMDIMSAITAVIDRHIIEAGGEV